jgi:hydroxyethylthiazole kinase
MKEAIAKLIESVRSKNPLVHHITNTVTINDCANVTLAIGGSPVMADSPEEAASMTKLAEALVINMGTLTESTFIAMMRAAQEANRQQIPVVLDPVGVGATTFRNEKAREFLQTVHPQIIRGNASEISALIGEEVQTRGVDAGNVNGDVAILAKRAAELLKAVVVVSGPVDYISDGNRTIGIENGHPILTKVTGTGCMATSLIGNFAGVTHDYFYAAVAGISVMGISGELAYRSFGEAPVGTGSFHIRLMDEVSLMNSRTWQKEVKFVEV